MLGYYARFARGGAAAITLGGAAGDFGLVHTPGADAKPWYDEHGGLYPAFHVFKGLAQWPGAAQWMCIRPRRERSRRSDPLSMANCRSGWPT